MDNIRFIPGTGNAYSCDTQGNIYSHYILGSHQISKEPQRKLSTWTGANNNYLMVVFSLDGNKTNQLVHRLIAATWIENPNNLPEVDHIDNNPQNNAVSNLRWITRTDNVARQTVDKGCLNGLRSHTELYKDSGELIAEFPSMTAACKYAAENFGCSKTGMQKYHKSNGYYIIAGNIEKRQKHSAKIRSKWDLYSPSNEYIGEFNSKREAGKYIKENIRDISVKLFSDTGKAYGYYVIEKSVETK